MKKIKHGWAVILSAILMAGYLAGAQEKHPRVAELESMLVKDGTEFLRGRFPSVPFLITVKVDPLRRITGSIGESRQSLPFMSFSAEEIQDEWDDPARTNFELMTRIRKTEVRVSLPNSLNETELAGIQDSLMMALNLTPGRDEVRIELRSWSTGRVDYTNYLMGGIVGFLLLYILFVFVLQYSFRRLTQALVNSESKSAAIASSPPLAPLPQLEPASKKTDLGSDVTFSDPIRVREVLKDSIDFLQKDNLFPTLEDMLIMDELAQANPHALGALLAEFPRNLQERVFSYTPGAGWVEAFLEPGEVSPKALDLAERLIHVSRLDKNRVLEDLYIAVWRLGTDSVQYFQSMDRDEAFAVLYRLPKSISIAVARRAFPGNWGLLMDSNFRPQQITTESAEQHLSRALAIKSWGEFSQLATYRHDRELLKYLAYADPQEEKEIYQVAPPHSMIHELRPPFYSVFDVDTTLQAQVVSQIGLDDWALALFNCDRSLRGQVEKHLSDKQRYLLIERLKQFDQSHPQKARISSARERIGRTLKNFKDQLRTNNIEETSRVETSDENVAA